MQTAARRDTAPEMAVRRAVHERGLRYRVDRRPLPSLRRRADLVFGPARVAVFIDGCYWHGCSEHWSAPSSNGDWWTEKIGRNRARDAETTAALTDAGWLVIRAWEHDEPAAVAAKVARAVTRRRPPGRDGGRR